jgi:hypothetical protein
MEVELTEPSLEHMPGAIERFAAAIAARARAGFESRTQRTCEVGTREGCLR